jgi:hypothetical protein
MTHTIARIFESLLRLLLPARGCHRAAGIRPAASREDAPTGCLPRVPAPVLRGEDIALVRPYVIAHERRQEARRRALGPAVHGIDAGPCWIHGVAVTA